MWERGVCAQASQETVHTAGIDDISSCIDWLIKEKVWSGGGAKKINTQNTFSLNDMTSAKMIKLIEEEGLEKELQLLVGKEWKYIEDSLRLSRKSKYE